MTRPTPTIRLPLFPLKTVLFPGGILPLKVFEQRYVDMSKTCLADDRPFGVCLITRGDEVAHAPGNTPEFTRIGTLARIVHWDMPQLGILHVTARGETRFEVRSHAVEPSGLVVGEVALLEAEPALALDARFTGLVRLLELIAARIGPQNFPAEHDYDNGSWVGYRLAELLPLPLGVKQSLLEIDDAHARLEVLQKFLEQQGVL